MSFEVTYFPISDTNLSLFKRWVKKPNDCVINALEVLNLLDSTCADLMRIVVGDVGLFPHQVLLVFKYLFSSYEWKFVYFTNIQSIYSVFVAMPIDSAILCAAESISNGHVFIIAKGSQNIPYLIDPQLGTSLFCDLRNTPCFQQIANYHKFFILYSKK
jgi:hypothetical protein